MLDDKTLEWLERRKNICTHCRKREDCRVGRKHNFSTRECRYWEPLAPGRLSGYVFKDFRDAAEFEARVAASATWRGEVMLCVHFQYKNDGCKSSNRLHTRMVSHWCKLKHHRLAVEREMIAEGKGPGRREEQ